jgi:hypothetical protein
MGSREGGSGSGESGREVKTVLICARNLDILDFLVI